MYSLKAYYSILSTKLNNNFCTLIHAPAFWNLILAKDDNFIVSLLMIGLSSFNNRRYRVRNCDVEIRLRIYDSLY